MITGIKKKLRDAYHAFLFSFYRNKKIIRGKNNTIIFKTAKLKNVVFDIKGNNNTILFGDHASIKACKITMRGNNHALTIGDHVAIDSSELKFEDHDCLINIGISTRILKHGEISVAEPFSKIEIGENCLFSSNVDIRNTDSHSIFDTISGKRINPAKNISIGNKVWIGAYVQVLKGVTINDNSIVGIRSLVTKEVPSNCLVAGVPAKIIKTNIDWCSKRIYT